MQFTKMHGLGNDYVYVNCFDQQVHSPEKLAVVISDRHFGIGADGLILIMPSDTADVRMRMFNADGSEAEMCANGIRCLAKFSYEHRLTSGHEPTQRHARELIEILGSGGYDDIREITVETGRGILTVQLAIRDDHVERLCVDMQEPILLPGQIPVSVTGQQAVGIPLTVAEENFLMACVSMGNPHAVIFCPDVRDIAIEQLGPLIENHRMFPRRTNVHFVQRLSDNEVKMRTWERGSGITLACGTGAAAVCVAGVLASKTEHNLLAHLPGGDLQLQWNQQDNHVYLVGPATEVFSGTWPNE